MLTDENISNGTFTIDLTKDRFVFKDPVTVIDDDWAKTNFLLSLSQIDNLKDLTLFSTNADRKITNTSLGMSLAINAPYAFTRYTDPPIPSRVRASRYFKVPALSKHNEATMGMGTYYSKSIDDNNSTSLLFLTPGVVEFASLISVFTRATDYKTSVIANEGRYPTGYDIGKFVGTVTVALFFPLRTLLVYAIKTAAQAIPLMTDHSYYHIKPTPAQYWLMVQNITNSLASERGILALKMKTNPKAVGSKYVYDNYRMDYLVHHFPLLFNKSGGVNVFGVATRAQKNIGKMLTDEYKHAADLASSKFDYSYPKQDGDSKDPAAKSLGDISSQIALDPHTTIEEFMQIHAKEPYNKPIVPGEGLPKTAEDSEENPNDQSTHEDGFKALPTDPSPSFLKSMFNSFASTTQHGADGPVFHVEYVGATTDTFSNTLQDIPLKDKINSLGGAARDIRFSLAGGNLFGDAVKSVTDGIGDLIAGSASGLTFGISDLVFGLLSGGYMRFGKMWKDSEAQLQSHTFKMRLGGPYNNKISQLIDQDLVVAMLLSLVLPQSTGHGTYTSPLMIKAFMRGICTLDRAMITSLTITRGGGNLGYTQEGRSTSLEVAVTITDMSELLVAPLGDSIFNNFNQETALSRYIATLAGRDHRTNSFIVPKLKIALSNTLMNLETRLSGSSLGVHLGDTFIGDIVGLLVPDNTLATFNSALKT